MYISKSYQVTYHYLMQGRGKRQGYFLVNPFGFLLKYVFPNSLAIPASFHSHVIYFYIFWLNLVNIWQVFQPSRGPDVYNFNKHTHFYIYRVLEPNYGINLFFLLHCFSIRALLKQELFDNVSSFENVRFFSRTFVLRNPS